MSAKATATQASVAVTVQAPDTTGLPKKLKAALDRLTPQERQFVMQYAGKARGNATLAAQLAGVSGPYATVASTASLMMQRPLVREALDAWYEAFAMNAAQLTASITDMIEANLGPFIKYDPKAKTIKLRVEDADTWEAHKHWIKSVEADPKTGKITRLVLHDAMAARRELAKVLKLYSDAPIFALHVHLRQLSDDELKALWKQRQAEGPQVGGEVLAQMRAGPVAVVGAPTEVAVG